ncbi:hypothetical protein DL768_010807 [Monosporascus sp. mg162]|nr:hypothetical protein DL768_010807 [Monosporascus sp. mg162]
MTSKHTTRRATKQLTPGPPKLPFPYRVFRPAQPESYSRRIRNVLPDGIPDYYDSAAEGPQQRPLATSALAAAPAGPAGATRPVDLQSLATNALAAVSATVHLTDGDDRRLPDGESRNQRPKFFL